MNYSPPAIDYVAIAPMIVIFGAAIVSVLIEAFTPRSVRRYLQLLIVFGSLIAAAALIVINASTRVVTAGQAIVIDGPALVLQGAIVIIALLGAALMAERSIDSVGDAFASRVSSLPGSEEEKQFTQRGYLQTEIWPLTLFAVLGMMLFVTSNDLLIMFIGLEIMSLPLYLMTGMARRRRLLSQEAALKYFLLGAFSSAFFLYGAALVYGYAGSITFPEIAQTVTSKPGESLVLMIGLGMVLIGLLFKVGAVPFHQWVPDVYQGAPTAGNGIHGGDSEDRRVRSSAAYSLRRLRRRAMGLGTDHLDHRHPHHAGGVDPRGRPVGHQANARVLIRGPSRLHPDRCRRRISCRYRQHDVLPHRVRLHHDRCVRDYHHGPGRWWRSNGSRNVVGHRP